MLRKSTICRSSRSLDSNTRRKSLCGMLAFVMFLYGYPRYTDSLPSDTINYDLLSTFRNGLVYVQRNCSELCFLRIQNADFAYGITFKLVMMIQFLLSPLSSCCAYCILALLYFKQVIRPFFLLWFLLIARLHPFSLLIFSLILHMFFLDFLIYACVKTYRFC